MGLWTIVPDWAMEAVYARCEALNSARTNRINNCISRTGDTL